jgi:hypothetical protein
MKENKFQPHHKIKNMDNIQFTKIRKGYLLENSNTDKKVYLKFDNIKNISYGYAKVYKKRKGWNVININDILCEKNDVFSQIDEFYKKVLNLYKRNKFIEVNLLYKGDKWFDDVWDFCEGFASVYKKGKGYNFINTNGELLWKEDKWFDEVRRFRNGFARVYIKGKGWNFIDPNGILLWKKDKWFYEAGNFKTDYVYDIITKCAQVRIEHTIQYISTDGGILKPSSYNNYDNFTKFNPWFV